MIKQKITDFAKNLSLAALIGLGTHGILEETIKYLPNFETKSNGFYQGMEVMAGRSGVDGKKYLWLQDKTNNITITAHDWYFEGDYGHLSADGNLDKFVGFSLNKENHELWAKTLKEKLDLVYENVVVEADPTIF